MGNGNDEWQGTEIMNGGNRNDKHGDNECGDNKWQKQMAGTTVTNGGHEQQEQQMWGQQTAGTTNSRDNEQQG